MEYVDAGRHRLFDEVLEPLRQRYGRAELQRVEQSLAIYLDERPANLPDPRQRPKFLYFPGVPSQPFYPRERFPFAAARRLARVEVDPLRRALPRVGRAGCADRRHQPVPWRRAVRAKLL